MKHTQKIRPFGSKYYGTCAQCEREFATAETFNAHFPCEAVTGEGNAPRVGQRIKLTRNVERFSDFIAPKGATGTITAISNGIVSVKMDEPLEGCEHWDNHIIWYDDFDQDFNSDVKYI